MFLAVIAEECICSYFIRHHIMPDPVPVSKPYGVVLSRNLGPLTQARCAQGNDLRAYTGFRQ